MATANPLDELRRRIGHGAAPGAFAALAEEHRRAGRLDQAVAVCREGLERYPTYVSARVTLGRALLDLGDIQGAIGELDHAVEQAPDNLAAVRTLEAARSMVPPPEPEPHLGTTEAPAEPSSMAWLTQPEEGESEGNHIVASFASERHPPLDQAPRAAESAALAVEPDAWDDTIHSPVASLDIWPDEPPPGPSGITPPDVVDAPARDGEALGDWVADALSPAPDDAPAATWGASVDAAVDEVFARAAGDVEPPPADTGTPASGAATTLDALQGLLEAIRARRSALAEIQSDVD